MALVPVITVTFSSTQVLVTDVTGAYNASSNPGGYGSPNPAFNALAHYVILKKKDAYIYINDRILIVDAYNPLTNTVFTASRSIDGWYEATKLSIPIWSAGTYPQFTIRYYNGVVYQTNTSTSATPGSDGTWVVVSDLTTIFGNSTIYTTILGRSTAYNADTYWSNQIASYTQNGFDSDSIDDKLRERLTEIEDNIQAIKVADGFGYNQSAELCALGLTRLGAVWNFTTNSQT